MSDARSGTSTRRIVVPAVLLLILSGAIAYLFLGDTTVRQTRNLRAARAHLPHVLRAIETFNAQGAKIRAGVYTGFNCPILMLGTVTSAEQLAAAKAAVEATSPPIEVLWRVTIEENSK